MSVVIALLPSAGAGRTWHRRGRWAARRRRSGRATCTPRWPSARATRCWPPRPRAGGSKAAASGECAARSIHRRLARRRLRDSEPPADLTASVGSAGGDSGATGSSGGGPVPAGRRPSLEAQQKLQPASTRPAARASHDAPGRHQGVGHLIGRGAGGTGDSHTGGWCGSADCEAMAARRPEWQEWWR